MDLLKSKPPASSLLSIGPAEKSHRELQKNNVKEDGCMDRKRIVKGVISTVLAVSCIVSMAFAAQPSDFKDYDPNAWYAEAAEFVVTNNIMTGTSAGTLEMNRTITRAEFVSLLDRLFMTYNKADLSKYTDMESTQWF